MECKRRLLRRIRFFNKRVLNRVTLRFAGSPHSPISVIRHVGRRSGRLYATPVIMEPLADTFVLALTYGTAVDWYQNVLAAGRCVLVWHGKEYAVESPGPLDAKTALPAFPLPLRYILQIMGTRDFFGLKSHSVIS